MSNQVVVLLTGPAGVGKSTLARQIADDRGWVGVSEDTYWSDRGWDTGPRSPAQEAQVRRQVVDDVLALVRSGRSVVLEFVLYSEPPNSLTVYEQACAEAADTRVVVLTASVRSIVDRVGIRGRPGDLERFSESRGHAVRQVKLLESAAMWSYEIIDTTDLSVDEVRRACAVALS